MRYEIKVGNCLDELKKMDTESVDCCVTSPPYWALRNYDHPDQIGQESTPEEYVANITNIFDEVKRVLSEEGTLWLNLGDSYLDKDMIGIPWRVALSLQKNGWHVRSDIIWNKSNCMPSPVKDRPTSSHEHIFLLSKSKKYYYDREAIFEPLTHPEVNASTGFGGIKHTSSPDKTTNSTYSGRKYDATKLKGKNKRDVWTVATKGYKGAHFAVYPPELVEPCILAGCPESGIVLDPFSGSGTTGVVALQQGRKYIGIELNPEYAKLSEERINDSCSNLFEVFQ